MKQEDRLRLHCYRSRVLANLTLAEFTDFLWLIDQELQETRQHQEGEQP